MTQQRILTKGAQGYDELKTVETSAGAADASKVPNTNASGFLDPSLLNAKNVSAGAGDAAKVPLLNASGVLDKTIVNSTVTSAGAADAGKRTELGTDGRLDVSVMPVGVGTDATTRTASEAISASNLINFAPDGSVRRADATNGRPAHGFAPAAIANGGTGTVLTEGTNSGLSGLTPGGMCFLGAAGATVQTPPTGAGVLWQPLGMAVSATAMSFSWAPPTTQAA